MPIVTMPDGVPVRFPDEMPPDQIRSLIQQKFPDAAAQAAAPAQAPAGQRGNLNVGVQGAGKGLAELAFGIPDIINTGVNLGLAGLDTASQFVGGPAISYRFSMPSQEAANLASDIGEKVGITTTDPSAMSTGERFAYNVNRFGSQAAGAIPALARVGVRRAAEAAKGDSLPVWYDPLVRPYGEGASARTVAGDAAGAVGAGTGVSVAEEYFPDSPIAATFAALAGGAGGVSTLSGAETAARLADVGRRRLAGGVAKDIPRDPATGLPYSQKAVDTATTALQNEVAPTRTGQSRAAAVRSARDQIAQNEAELRAGGLEVMPSSAALADNPGLSALERQVRLRDQGASITRDREFQTAVRNTLDDVAPEGATASPLIRLAEQEMAARRAAAQGDVEHAETYADRAQAIRAEDAQTVAPYRGQKPAASQVLDRNIISNSLDPMDTARRSRYNAVPNEPTDGRPLYEAAQAVRSSVRDLPPDARQEVLPEARVRDFERLGAPILDDEGNIIGYRQVPFQTLNQMQPILSADKARARASNAPPPLIDNLRTLQDTILQIAEDFPPAAEANRFFHEEYAPVWGRDAGEAFKFRKDVNKDRRFRTASPPEKTAGRFLVPGEPSKSQALSRITASMRDPSEAHAATRRFLMADLAEANVIDPRTGVLRPDVLRKWNARNHNTLAAVPGLQKEINNLLSRAQRGERIAGRFADEIKAARENLRLTEDQINRSALRQVVDADPDKAVAAIMSDSTSSGRRLKELIDLTANNPEARTGLKAAVRDYLIDKATNTGSEKLVTGDQRGPVSRARLTRLFKEHENELAQIFSPEEMNTLRAGHKALELAGVGDTRVTSRSDTAEKTVDIIEGLRNTSLGKGIEAALRVKYGILKTGGLIATGRRLASGIGQKEADEAARLIERAAFDPRLMRMLLGREMPIGSPRWNARLNVLLGAAEYGRKEYRKAD